MKSIKNQIRHQLGNSDDLRFSLSKELVSQSDIVEYSLNDLRETSNMELFSNRRSKTELIYSLTKGESYE